MDVRKQLNKIWNKINISALKFRLRSSSAEDIDWKFMLKAPWMHSRILTIYSYVKGELKRFLTGDIQHSLIELFALLSIKNIIFFFLPVTLFTCIVIFTTFLSRPSSGNIRCHFEPNPIVSSLRTHGSLDKRVRWSNPVTWLEKLN